MIALIDYKMGNIRSVAKAFESVGAKVTLSASPAVLKKARALVLPGVGAFRAGMSNLRALKLIKEIKNAVRDGKPFLGICLGAQLLFSESEEHGISRGLGLIPGKVLRFRANLKIPHMGWNTITQGRRIKDKGKSRLLAGIPEGSYFYFVHSYYLKPESVNEILAFSDYGRRFAAVVGRGNTFGIQFHPEKSSDLGLKILENFCKIAGEL